LAQSFVGSIQSDQAIAIDQCAEFISDPANIARATALVDADSRAPPQFGVEFLGFELFD
jgi:hypothetical protein